MKKKMNNKGFSLVELIIVVAIMAVLMVVLAPQLLKYVEKTRLQKDNSAISEIVNAIEIACADEKIINSIPSTDTPVGSVSHPDTNSAQTITFSASGTALEKELAEVIGTVTTSSTTYKAGGNLSIKVKNVDGKVTVTVGNYVSEVKGSATDKEF